MRCFIAIDVDEKIKDAISALQVELKDFNANLRWVKPENIHLTLKFLGNVDEGMLDKIKRALRVACSGYKNFTLEAKGMGIFPDRRRPRVLWVDIKENDSLKSLQRAIEDAMVSTGFERDERGFSPHLTIARFRSSAEIGQLYDKIQLYKERYFGTMNVDSVLLMESRLRPAGAEYTRLFEVGF